MADVDLSDPLSMTQSVHDEGTSELKPACDTDADHAIDLSVCVDKFVWKYMEKSIRFSADVGKLISQAKVTFEDQPDSKIKLTLTGEDRNKMYDLVENIKQLIESCEQTVQSVKTPKQETTVYSKIVEKMDTLNQSISGHVFLDHEDIVVTGTKEEIDNTLGMLEELYGLRRGDKETSVEPNSLKLWKVGAVEPVSLEVDTGFWQYMNKQDGPWVKQLDQVRGNASLQITETPITENGGVMTRIDLSGMNDSVAEAKDELQKLIDRCSQDVKTLRSAKLDEKVFTKASKFLHVLCKTGAVATGIDCIISVTGTDTEVRACKEKLEKLNVNLADAHPTDRPTAAVTSSLDSSTFDAPRDQESRNVSRPKQASSSDASVTSSRSDLPLTGVSSTSAKPGEQKFLEVPIPIEEQLWSFMQKRRSAQLQELRDGYLVQLTSYPAGEPGFVMIHLSAESDDMLECALASLMQLLQQLHDTVVVQVLQTEEGRSLSSEVGQRFNQLIAGLDAIIDVSGNKIIITGPREATVECQQRIASFVQQQQQQQQQLRGPSGMGGGMGMMRQPQGMGMGMGMGMDMGMGSGPGFGGGYRVGGRSLPGSNNDVDFQTAVRNQRNMNHALTAGPIGSRSGGFAGMGDSEMMGGNFGSASQSFGGMGTSRFDEPGGMTSSGNPGLTLEEIMDDDDEEIEQATCRPTESDGSVTGRQQGTMRNSGASTTRELTGSSKSGQSGPDASKPRVRFADEPEPVQRSSVTSSSTAAVASSSSYTSTATVSHHLSQCSVCQMSDSGASSASDSGRCSHSFCVSCVKEYFSNSSTSGPSCPVCGSDNESPASRQHRTQPSDGRMLVTHDSSFRLPGFENKSRGTITVIYSFPSGIQKDPQPHPGQRYSAVTKTAFFPMNPEGSTIVDQLQRAFDDGLVFAMVPGAKGQLDEIDWNGIDHKTNVFGGPQLHGYPDPVYLPRVQNQLKAKGIH